MVRHFFSARYLFLLSAFFVLETVSVASPQSAPPPRAGSATAHQQGIYLVFPLENAAASPRLEWVGEGLEELTMQRLSGAGARVDWDAGRLAGVERDGLVR